MRSKQLNLSAYDTDKIQHHYLELYDPILSCWTDKEIKLLEMGIYKGGSLKLWRDYFPLERGLLGSISSCQGFRSRPAYSAVQRQSGGHTVSV